MLSCDYAATDTMTHALKKYRSGTAKINTEQTKLIWKVLIELQTIIQPNL